MRAKQRFVFRTFALVFYAVLLVFLQVSICTADVLFAKTGYFSSISAGFYSEGNVGKLVPAPESGDGVIEYSSLPFEFVNQGDIVPSISSIGIGIVLGSSNFEFNEELIVHFYRPGDCCKDYEWWKIYADENGNAWVGHSYVDQIFPEGKWRFSIFSGEKFLLDYEFSVVPSKTMPKLSNRCENMSS